MTSSLKPDRTGIEVNIDDPFMGLTKAGYWGYTSILVYIVNNLFMAVKQILVVLPGICFTLIISS